MNHQFSRRNRHKIIPSLHAGFTLIEMIVVIAILGILLLAAIWSINPLGQFSKANDSNRERDLKQIKIALDAYYSDHNCYPRAIPFGQQWKVKNVIYMKLVPQDPSCKSDGTNCYVYQQNDDTCPQWNALFAQLSKAPVQSTCEIASQSSCSPVDMTAQWACETSGTVDCPYLSSVSLSDGSPVSSSDIDAVVDADATPTPTIPIAPQGCQFPRYICAPTCNDAGVGNGDYCASNCDGAC